jgi:hypothetical protein
MIECLAYHVIWMFLLGHRPELAVFGAMVGGELAARAVSATLWRAGNWFVHL